MKKPSLESLGLYERTPKICIPLMVKDLAGLSLQLLENRTLPGDLYEWRLDRYEGDIELGRGI